MLPSSEFASSLAISGALVRLLVASLPICLHHFSLTSFARDSTGAFATRRHCASAASCFTFSLFAPNVCLTCPGSAPNPMYSPGFADAGSKWPRMPLSWDQLRCSGYVHVAVQSLLRAKTQPHQIQAQPVPQLPLGGEAVMTGPLQRSFLRVLRVLRITVVTRLNTVQRGDRETGSRSSRSRRWSVALIGD